MNQKLINAIMFTTGAAIGSLVTWRIMKSHCERYVQDEIDKFVEEWPKRTRIAKPQNEQDDIEDGEGDEDDDASDDAEVREYHQIAKKYGGEGDGDLGFPHVNGPVVITPDEFGDGNFEHSLIALTYYSDGVLANDWYEVFDIEDTIGEESLEHFGDHAEGVLHVRNEQNAADYEIVLDPRKFKDVASDDSLMAAYAT